jgi:hypothetical protein
VILPGAHCVTSWADAGQMAGRFVCMVHTHEAPCPRDGEPASPAVVHTDAIPSRNRARAAWLLRTHGQRTLVIHVGDSLSGDHSLDVNGVDCECRPEVIWGKPCHSERGDA